MVDQSCHKPIIPKLKLWYQDTWMFHYFIMLYYIHIPLVQPLYLSV